MRSHWSLVSVLWIATLLSPAVSSRAEDTKPPTTPIRVGIVGLDAHGLPWTRILNSPDTTGELATMRIVAAYPGGSPDIPQSVELLGKSVEPVRALGVEIVDSIGQLLPKVDAVMILAIDGRTHLPHARTVFPSGKPVFIDKPMAGSLADAMRIFALAKKHNVPCFSSSALRFAPGTQAVLTDPKVGPVLGCSTFSPCAIEPHHPDFFWYGIHGVEPLYTLMGTGCRTVSRVHGEGADVAVGLWKDGRIGAFRGTREGAHTYGATVFGAKGIVQAGKFEGYEPLLVEIAKFFKTGKPPVAEDVTLEILAFMEAADLSKERGGRPVDIEEVMQRAREAVAKDR